MQSKARTVPQYLAELSPDRRKAIAAVRKVVLDNLLPGYVETMQYEMIGYVVPLEKYPVTYNRQPLTLAALASQKNHMAFYLCFHDHKETQDWFRKEWKATGKKSSPGKSCLHFKKPEDLPLGLLAKVMTRFSMEKFIVIYEKSRQKQS